MTILMLLLGVAIGAAGTWLALRSRIIVLSDRVVHSTRDLDQAKAELHSALEQLNRQGTTLARLEEARDQERRAAEEKLALLSRAEEILAATFKSLSADALRENNASFLQLATTKLQETQVRASSELDERKAAVEQLVTPVQQALEQFNQSVRQMELSREGAYKELRQQMQGVAQTQERLQQETTRLVSALRGTHAQGQWGEIQLRRIVELAGMVEYCDFQEQATTKAAGGERLRPDLVVRLPGGKYVVVDAKTPLGAYLTAMDTQDEQARDAHLEESAKQVRAHMRTLSGKAYWDQLPETPEFVVMFLPEPLYIMALRYDPALIENAAQARVIMAGPSTLIALLMTVAHGWSQERIAENAHRISELGRELYQRIAKFAEHFARVGHELGNAVQVFNQAVGSLESRVLVTARRFVDLSASSAEPIQTLSSVDHTPRALTAPALTGEVSSQMPPARELLGPRTHESTTGT